MHRRMVLSEIVFLVLVLAVEIINARVVKPVVPRFCERLCNETAGCCSSLYQAKDLSCHLFKSTSREHYLSKGMGEKFYGSYMTCPNDVQLPQKDSKCPRSSNRQTKQKITRLLMLPSNEFEPPRQLSLQNYSVDRYAYLPRSTFSAVAFISTLNKLIIATTYPHELYFAFPNDKKKIVIRKTKVVGIDVDEGKQLIFLIMYKSQACVNVMDTDGSHSQSVVGFRKWPRLIAVDPKRSVFYVVFQFSAIVRYNYGGSGRLNVAKGFILTPVCVDSDQDVLYFIKDSFLYKLSLLDNTIVKMSRFGNSNKYVLVIENKFYLLKWGKLYVSNENGKQTKSISVGRVRVILCAIS